MKRPTDRHARRAAEAAVQFRALAIGQLHTAVTAQYAKARAAFMSMTEKEQQRLAARFAGKMKRIGPGSARARLLVHLGQIHGDLASKVADSFTRQASATARF